MKVRFSNADEFRGKKYKADQKADLPNGVAFKLIGKGLAKKITDEEFNTLDMLDVLEIEDFNTLKVGELKEVCVLIEVSSSGNKADLVAVIEEKLNRDKNVTLPDMSKMDKEALVALAKEEEVALPEDADEDAIRDILAEALVE